MENATKALLIAGSVLIVILLIAMGLRIFNSTQETVDSTQSTMQTSSISMYNSKFTQYLGVKSKSVATSLIQTIIANNATSANIISVTIVTKTGSEVNYSAAPEQGEQIFNNVFSENPNKVKITCEYNNKGYINKIKFDFKNV